MSFFFLYSYTLLAIRRVFCTRGSDRQGCCAISTAHILVIGSRLPLSDRVGSNICVMYILVVVRWTSYPLSQNCPNDSRHLFCISRKRYAVRTAAGKYSIANCAVCDACMIAPFGVSTRMPLAQTCLLVHGAFTHK